MILPVLIKSLFNIPQIILRIRVEAPIGKSFQNLPLCLQALLTQNHQPFEATKEFILTAAEISDPRHIDGYNPDRAC